MDLGGPNKAVAMEACSTFAYNNHSTFTMLKLYMYALLARSNCMPQYMYMCSNEHVCTFPGLA